MFSNIASQSSDDKWDTLMNELVRHDFTMKICNLESLLKNLVNFSLSYKDKEALFETYKVSLDVNSESLDDRQITLHALSNARK